jgi:transposase-like protein
MSGQRRTAYEAGFKLKVVACALETNNSVAARQFSVNEKQVRMWRKNQASLELMPKRKKAARGLSVAFPQLEQELNQWILTLRQNGFIVSRTMIRIRALNLMKEPAFQPLKPKAFVASAGWCTRFMNRNGLCLRQRTKISQKLPRDLEEKIENFQKFVIALRKKYDFEMGQIGNMDETPVCFDMPSNQTVERSGVKTVQVKTTGHEKTRFTVVLCRLADGTRLSPPSSSFSRGKLFRKARSFLEE